MGLSLTHRLTNDWRGINAILSRDGTYSKMIMIWFNFEILETDSGELTSPLSYSASLNWVWIFLIFHDSLLLSVLGGSMHAYVDPHRYMGQSMQINKNKTKKKKETWLVHACINCIWTQIVKRFLTQIRLAMWCFSTHIITSCVQSICFGTDF